MYFVFFFQAEDGIRDLVRSRGLGDVYKRQGPRGPHGLQPDAQRRPPGGNRAFAADRHPADPRACLLYTSDAADDLLCVDLGGRRILKKKTNNNKLKENNQHTL